MAKIRGRARNGPIKPEDEFLIVDLLAAAGRRDEARSLAEPLARKAVGSVDLNYELARVWALLGDKKLAIHYLEEAFAAGYDDPYMILIDPPLASLQNDPAIDRLAPARAQSPWGLYGSMSYGERTQTTHFMRYSPTLLHDS